jgi:hypothetical protein
MGGAATSTLRIWYDGESSGVPFSAGSANVSGGSSAVETATDPHAGSACMSVSLNASGGWAHLGWQPDKSGTSYDLSADAAIEFWIKSAAGPITGLELEMHGPNGGCPWVHLADYLSGGVTTTWQKASIPLTAFQIDRTRIQTFDFWLTTGSAAFFVDDGRW